MRTLLCAITMLALSLVHSTLADDTSRILAKPHDAVPSIADARKVLDLSQIPLAPGVEIAPRRPIFSLSYDCAASPKESYKHHQRQFTSTGWKELPGSSIEDALASGTFQKSGYSLSLMVMPAGGKSRVSIIPHGNVPLAKLPSLPGSTVLSDTPAQIMLIMPETSAPLARKITQDLIDRGWKTYGEAGPTRSFVQGSTLLNVMISDAPGQAGKSMVMYSTVLRSADLPVTDDATAIQYSDALTQVSWQSSSDPKEVIARTKSLMEAQGWKSTTTEPLYIDYKWTMFFRSDPKTLRKLEVRDLKPGSRALLKEFLPEEIPDQPTTAAPGNP